MIMPILKEIYQDDDSHFMSFIVQNSIPNTSLTILTFKLCIQDLKKAQY